MKTIEHTSSEYRTYNAQLRSYMVRIFGYMSIALIITALTSYMTYETGLIRYFYNARGVTGLGWLVTFAPLALVLIIVPQIRTMDISNARLMLALYSAVMGMSMSHIFISYAGVDITRVFFISASLFLAMSLYGYTTKRDLTSLGSFMIMGLIGVLIASLVNIFLKSSAIYFIVSIISVFVFIGLTAYDAQKLKDNFYRVKYEGSDRERVSLMGALILYMDFINLFMALLHLSGDRKSR